MTIAEWVSELLAERLPSLEELHAALSASLATDNDAQRAVAAVRYLASELLVTAQAASECLTGAPAPLFAEDFIRAEI